VKTENIVLTIFRLIVRKYQKDEKIAQVKTLVHFIIYRVSFILYHQGFKTMENEMSETCSTNRAVRNEKGILATRLERIRYFGIYA
jgi:hypothetical protein